jgi:hypothetical protein
MTGTRGVFTWICGLCNGDRRRLASMLTYAFIGHHDGGLFVCPRCDLMEHGSSLPDVEPTITP